MATRAGAWASATTPPAAAGLIVRTPDGRPAFVGDAIADPLTGICRRDDGAARLVGRTGRLVRPEPARHGGAGRDGPRLELHERGELRQRSGAWWLRVGRRERRVSPPPLWRTTERAAAFGSDTRRIVEEFN